MQIDLSSAARLMHFRMTPDVHKRGWRRVNHVIYIGLIFRLLMDLTLSALQVVISHLFHLSCHELSKGARQLRGGCRHPTTSILWATFATAPSMLVDDF